MTGDDAMPRQFKVTVNGREYDVSVLEVTTHAPTAAPMPIQSFAPLASGAGHSAPPPVTQAAAASSAGDVLAGMGGIVADVRVSIGQSVAAGDHVMTLEAMKMKTPVTAPRAGRIIRVLVALGDTVEAGRPLLTID
jgi:glutaconyl-CoA/methylmalonyl-CoA decarboxylase subunit gamma